MADSPKGPGMVTCTIDGREVTVKPGTTVIQAAKSIGIKIPHYCYHKRLSIVASCRMCLVEMSNAPGGKLMPACQVPVAEGIAIQTDTPRVKDQQRATLEFLLLKHPVDCAICDKAGECKLQDYYFKYDLRPSRLDMPKLDQAKRLRVGPTVLLDQERCILCTRCVRFMTEVAKEPQLAVAERGNRSVITTFPGKPLDSKYAGNVVDLCPVGALTLVDFRFAGRVWFMSAARSICAGCARGCNTYLDTMGDVPYRYRPRENEAVNQQWMCDDGRLSYRGLKTGRLLAARVGRGMGVEAPLQKAIEEAGRALRSLAEAHSAAVLLSPVASLEDLMAAVLVAREGLGLEEVYSGGRPAGWEDAFLKRADENPNRKGLELAARAFGVTLRPFSDLKQAISSGKIKGVWAVGAEVPDQGAEEALGRLDVFVCQAYSESAVTREATVLLPAAPHSEMDGTFVNFEGRAQRFEAAYPPRGESRPHWALSAEIGRVVGLSYQWRDARALFEDLGTRLEGALADFRWDLPPTGVRGGLLPLQAGTADGRLPGQRERAPLAPDEVTRP
jgi:NADH-quinone oxidoreductase subunit G